MPATDPMTAYGLLVSYGIVFAIAGYVAGRLWPNR